MLAVLQVAAIVVLGAATVERFSIFHGGDEGAHVAYVDEIADHGRLPLLGRERSPWQVTALYQDIYPRHPAPPTGRPALAYESYEAFQPPLYYLLAVPAFEAGGDFVAKVKAVRIFDLLLLLASVAILAALTRAVFAGRWRLPFCMALVVVMWPGVIVREVTVSNAALELPLALLYVLACWNAATGASRRWLVAAGGVLGLCLLTSLTLVCLVPLLVVPMIACRRGRPGRRTLLASAVGALLPLLLVSPWLVSNERRYGALAATAIAKRMQMPDVNPSGKHYGIGAVASGVWNLTRAELPQDWWAEYDKPVLDVLLRVLPLVLVALALGAVLVPCRRSAAAAGPLLGVPFVLGVAMLIAIVVLAQWPVLLPRYLYPEWPLLALLAARRWNSARIGRGAVLAGTGAAALAVAGVWVYMAGAYWYTNFGASLGIHAA